MNEKQKLLIRIEHSTNLIRIFSENILDCINAGADKVAHNNLQNLSEQVVILEAQINEYKDILPFEIKNNIPEQPF